MVHLPEVEGFESAGDVQPVGRTLDERPAHGSHQRLLVGSHHRRVGRHHLLGHRCARSREPDEERGRRCLERRAREPVHQPARHPAPVRIEPAVRQRLVHLLDPGRLGDLRPRPVERVVRRVVFAQLVEHEAQFGERTVVDVPVGGSFGCDLLEPGARIGVLLLAGIDLREREVRLRVVPPDAHRAIRELPGPVELVEPLAALRRHH